MSGIATVSSEQVGVLLVPTAALSHFQFTSRPNGRLLHFVQSFLATVWLNVDMPQDMFRKFGAVIKVKVTGHEGPEGDYSRCIALLFL